MLAGRRRRSRSESVLWRDPPAGTALRTSTGFLLLPSCDDTAAGLLEGGHAAREESSDPRQGARGASAGCATILTSLVCLSSSSPPPPRPPVTLHASPHRRTAAVVGHRLLELFPLLYRLEKVSPAGGRLPSAQSRASSSSHTSWGGRGRRRARGRRWRRHPQARCRPFSSSSTTTTVSRLVSRSDYWLSQSILSLFLSTSLKV